MVGYSVAMIGAPTYLLYPLLFVVHTHSSLRCESRLTLYPYTHSLGCSLLSPALTKTNQSVQKVTATGHMFDYRVLLAISNCSPLSGQIDSDRSHIRSHDLT